MMVTTSLSMLPEETEIEVLLRVPMKSNLRSSAVCHRWQALLSSTFRGVLIRVVQKFS